MEYILWIDDVRNPGDREWSPNTTVIWARDVEQAIFCVKQHDLPAMMYLDHDLGKKDGKDETVMQFLRWLEQNYYPPTFYYNIISANPEGAKSIQSFLESWKRVYYDRYK